MRSLEDVIFVEFDHNYNFISDDIYLMLLRAYETNKTVDSLMEQYKIFYIKYYLFHDVMAIVKSIIFKLKTIKYIYI